MTQSLSQPFSPTPSSRTSMREEDFRRALLEHLFFTCAADPRFASPLELYQALSHAVRDRLIHRWLASRNAYRNTGAKHVCYLSSEFLVGRSLGLCLVNLGLFETAQSVMADRGHNLTDILESEGDPGLGNGGLGRLAACFMDSLATLELPAIGYGIRYEYGIFEQLIEDGWQVERRDNWLQYGNPWEIPRHDRAQTVGFGGTVKMRHDDEGNLRAYWLPATEVRGLPFDSLIIGHRTNNVNTLRLWSARATRDFNLDVFNSGDFLRAVEEKVETESISKVLYPSDHSEKGKMLRLKQQYFFVACSLGDVLRRHKAGFEDFDTLPENVTLQLNDTHPSVAVAELMRLLVDIEGYAWDRAWDITRKTLAYTNHTLLPEALEKWPVPMFQALLPRHLEIIFEINRRFLRMAHVLSGGDREFIRRVSLIEEGHVQQVRMAHLAVVGSFSVNGVAAMHSELLKHDLLKDFYRLWPEKFNNKTNGVSTRRWMVHSNPGLTSLITSRIGPDWTERSFPDIRRLASLSEDVAFLRELGAVKQANKARLGALVKKTTGIELDPSWMFVIQVKRIHEYKRQLMAILQVVALYFELKRHPHATCTPRVFLFAGKAAAGYLAAKLHIKLIHDVAALVNDDPDMADKLRVVFVPNYGVSLAETIIPAADLSVQISLAGQEASGTGNMKFAMNGAVTIGTLDGANVEILDEVGEENLFQFGLTVEQVEELRRGGYRPKDFIACSPRLREALQMVESGFFCRETPERFVGLVNHLRDVDRFMVCADFDSYYETSEAAARAYADPVAWQRKCLANILAAPRFSSDETISGYAREIWKLSPLPVDVQRELQVLTDAPRADHMQTFSDVGGHESNGFGGEQTGVVPALFTRRGR